VVVDAYAQLVAEGFPRRPRRLGHRGERRRPAPLASVGLSPSGEAPPYNIDLRPGLPDLASFPRAVWLAATRDALRLLPDEELGYVARWGALALERGARGHDIGLRSPHMGVRHAVGSAPSTPAAYSAMKSSHTGGSPSIAATHVEACSGWAKASLMW